MNDKQEGKSNSKIKLESNQPPAVFYRLGDTETFFFQAHSTSTLLFYVGKFVITIIYDLLSFFL